jgi:hypothetical protein
MNIATSIMLEPDPIYIDPRPCGLCGRTIDQHECFDDGEGPEFFCADILPDEMTLDELERRAELIRREEVAEIVARLEAMDDPSRRLPPAEVRPSYRTAQSTIDAFWYVVSNKDANGLADWLADHPRDETYLKKILERKCSTAAI